LVCRFLPILKLLFTLLSSRVLLTNYLFFIDSKWIQKSICFVCHTLEENRTKTKFKIGEKPHTKHHQIDQILMFFDRFDDVWYAVFFSILKSILCIFFSRVLPTKLLFFFRPKMDPKKNNFVSNTLEENKTKTSFKIGQNPHTKHHQIDQKT